jgi:hypothetical protein
MLEFFLDPYPDEILYSTWARYSDQARITSATEVLQELFENSNAHPIVDLPCHLGNFYRRLPFGHHYTIDYFIDQHTLLPLYRPFIPQSRFEALREQMIMGDGQAIHRRAEGNSQTSRTTCLRYCPRCMQVDKETYGECYWHRIHQLPGVVICPVHLAFIENSPIRIRTPLSNRNFISAERAVTDYTCRVAGPTPLHKTLIAIARDISYLLADPHILFDPPFFREQYRALLEQCDFLTARGHLRSIDLLDAFINYFTPDLLSQFNCKIQVKSASCSWLNDLVGYLGDTHPPLQHLLAIHFLGSTAEAFLHQRIKSAAIFGDGPWPCLNPVCALYKQRCIYSYQVGDTRSGSHISVRIFSCTCGFTYCRFGPDLSAEDVFRKDWVLSYGPLWEAKLQELWLNPAVTRRSIARCLGIAASSVSRHAVKLQLPIPRSGGRGPRQIHDVTWYRAQWLTLLMEMPEEGISVLARKASAVYDWLYCHDREWLTTNRPQPRQGGGKKKPKEHLPFQLSGTASPNMDGRSVDVSMAQEVINAAQQIIAAPGPPKKVSIRAIGLSAPQLFHLRKTPNKIPLTMQALEALVETREAFATRRVWWAANQYQEKLVCPSRRELERSAHVLPLLHDSCVQQALDEALDMLSQFA